MLTKITRSYGHASSFSYREDHNTITNIELLELWKLCQDNWNISLDGYVGEKYVIMSITKPTGHSVPELEYHVSHYEEDGELVINFNNIVLKHKSKYRPKWHSGYIEKELPYGHRNYPSKFIKI